MDTQPSGGFGDIVWKDPPKPPPNNSTAMYIQRLAELRANPGQYGIIRGPISLSTARNDARRIKHGSEELGVKKGEFSASAYVIRKGSRDAYVYARYNGPAGVKQNVITEQDREKWRVAVQRFFEAADSDSGDTEHDCALHLVDLGTEIIEREA